MRNNADFHGVKLSHQSVFGNHDIFAHLDGEEVGALSLGSDGTVHDVTVDRDHEGKGIATAMWNHAKSLYASGRIDVEPKHSSATTEEGYRWAMSTGDPVPPRDPEMFGPGDEKMDWSGRK
jgi:GNAT superfamily N-acetyltransferase